MGKSNDRYTRIQSEPALTIGTAAKLAGLHQQTLRIWEQRGLVVPARTPKGTRLYSLDDVERLRRVAALSAEGVTIRGIEYIFKLENRISSLVSENAQLQEQVNKLSRVIEAMRIAELQAIEKTPRDDVDNLVGTDIPDVPPDVHDTALTSTSPTRRIAIRRTVSIAAFLPENTDTDNTENSADN